MNQYGLGFISDHNIYEHVKTTILKYRCKISLKEFKKNLIDPIKLTFDSNIYKKDINVILEREIIRQCDKSNTNLIGYFHQNIFKYLHNDWKVPDKGYDIVNEKNSMYIEMKNKHNTMNSSSVQKIYMKMKDTIAHNPVAKCFLVEVIAKKSQNIVWQITLDGTRVFDKRIRKMSVDKFYELVTKNPLSFKNFMPCIANYNQRCCQRHKTT